MLGAHAGMIIYALKLRVSQALMTFNFRRWWSVGPWHTDITLGVVVLGLRGYG